MKPRRVFCAAALFCAMAGKMPNRNSTRAAWRFPDTKCDTNDRREISRHRNGFFPDARKPASPTVWISRADLGSSQSLCQLYQNDMCERCGTIILIRERKTVPPCGPENRRAGSTFHIEKIEACARRAGFPAIARAGALPILIQWSPEVFWSPELQFPNPA